jgi:hypothetical protein
MTLRTDNPQKRRAHALLDDVRAGLHHESAAVVWALRTLGEPVELLNLHPLEAARSGRHGTAPGSSVCTRPALALHAAASHMQAARTGGIGNGGGAYQVAGGGA